MNFLIILLSKFLYWIGKLFGKGNSFPGRIALKIDNAILKKIKLPDNMIIVTGSNGKTSTVEMIYQVLVDAGFSVGCNLKGSNQTEGIATMILNSSSLFGVVNKDVLVIESDEKCLSETINLCKPKYLVITNLYRDELTNNGHPELIFDMIHEALTQDIHLVINADDPLSSLFGYKRDNVTYFGMNRNALSKKDNDSSYDDGKYCPHCKNVMKYEYYHFNHIGKYHCEKCGHSRKEPHYAITNLDLNAGQIVINKKHQIKMNFASMDNAYNIVATFAIARIFGVDESKIVSSLTDYASQNNRIKKFTLNGHKGMLITSKHENSISYDQSLLYVSQQSEDCTVVVLIDEISKHDSVCETSWIWDVDFELLSADCVKKIILAGKFANDLAVRFENKEIGMNKVVVKTNFDEMMKEIKENLIGNIFVITCGADKTKFMNRR